MFTAARQLFEQHFCHPIISDPKTDILGSSEVFLSKGSTLNLTCVITQGPSKQPFIIWTHNSKVSHDFFSSNANVP